MRVPIILTLICSIPLIGMALADDLAKPPPDVTLTITAVEQGTWAQVGPVLDACIGAAAVRGDVASCKPVSQFLAAYAAKVAAAKPAQ